MDPEVNGLRRADRLMGSGALVLLAVLFLAKWYEASARLGSAKGLKVLGGSFNGWHAFTHSRWIWLLTGIVALAAVLLTLSHRKPDLGVRLGTIVAGLGGLSSATILYRIIHHPLGQSDVRGQVHVSYSAGIELGAWIALIAALTITYGGYLAMRSEGAADAGRAGTGGPGGRDSPKGTGEPPEPPAGAFSGIVVESQPPAPDDALASPSGAPPQTNDKPLGETQADDPDT